MTTTHDSPNTTLQCSTGKWASLGLLLCSIEWPSCSEGAAIRGIGRELKAFYIRYRGTHRDRAIEHTEFKMLNLHFFIKLFCGRE